ncbi:unnamed protein product [Candidula unifasciata]|uniref:Zinc finger CCCH domain-containing protein 14 n=1 Tax=Candidula unifasciata TaxID=100452 RepID=A0A8S3ZC44_9EUPU|nr:unnamed protein product [Candidula unifasciata]
MEVGTEISQKIRSAIKAKLVELGAYVDDELPDYIMVMVANKRSRAQMRKDLGLFLGTNTVSFTEWLHRLLAKLQTIRSQSDLDKSAGKQVKGGKLKAEGDKQKGETQTVGLNSPTNQENIHSAEACLEKTQADIDSGEGNKYTDASDSRETGSSSTKQSLKSECDDNVRQDILTDTSPRDAVSEGEAMEAEVVNARRLSIESKISSASHSPGHGQSYSVSRKRKIQSELADVGKESDAFHTHNPAFDNTANELTADASSSLQVTRNVCDGDPEGTTHDHDAELPDHDGQPPQKVIRLAESLQLEDIKQALAEVLDKRTEQNDDIAHFSRMLESSLRKLRPRILSLAKIRIQEILYEFETLAFQEENLVGNQQNANRTKQASCLSNDSEIDSFGKCSKSLLVDSGSDGSRNLLEDKHASCVSSQTNPNLLEKEIHDSNYLLDNVDNCRPKINSGKLDNHLTVTREYSTADTRVNSQPRESLAKSQKSTGKSAKHSSKEYDTVVKFGDKERTAGKLQDQSQSPGSLGKADIGSPSSVHSCPLTGTLSLRIKRNVSTASQESPTSPVDLQSKPCSSHAGRSKHTSAKNKILPSILVDSIHTRKRSETLEPASVLRQGGNKDRSPRPVDASKQDVQDSPKLYGPEALKVMAKNLRITVINKQAVKSSQESSSEDSDDEEDDDSSDNDDEEEEEDARVNNSSIAKVKAGSATQKKKASSVHSSA